MGCSGAVCWTNRPRREQAVSGAGKMRCGVKESGPALLAEGLSGLAEQGHQQEGQCHCVAGTPEVHPARVECKASSSCSPDPTFPLEPLLAMLGRGDTWHLLCHPFLAPSSHPLYVAGGFPPLSHTHYDALWLEIKRHCSGSAISWGPAGTSGLCVTPLLSAATQGARGSMGRPGKTGWSWALL